MKAPKPSLVLVGGIGGLMVALWFAAAGREWSEAFAAPAPPPPVLKATSSSPIALSPDNKSLWSVNPENDSVSLFNVFNDANVRLKELIVGDEPQAVAIHPSGLKVYVCNAAEGSVTVIDAGIARVIKKIPVGIEPHGLALTPDGTQLFVANTGSDSISVIKTKKDKVIATVPVGPKPRGIAIEALPTATARVFVSHFLSQLRNNGKPIDQNEGADDGRDGRVTILSAQTHALLGVAVLNPLADTGFKSDGTTLGRVGVRNPPVFDHVTAAFPSLSHAIVLKGTKAYISDVGSSPDGPVRFNVNVQGLINVLSTTANADANQTLNMNKGVQFETVGQRIFNTTPFALAFKNNSNVGYCALGGIDRIIQVVLDANGAPTVNEPINAADVFHKPIRIAVGQNPRGLVINDADTRCYVMNFISRDVSVVDIDPQSANFHKQIIRIPSAALPAPLSLAGRVHRGEELFVTGIGPAGNQENALPPAGRMSDFGWGNCYNCHPDGLADGVTWMFPDGPRQTISLDGLFAHPQPQGTQLNANGAPLAPSSDQRVINWSAVRDEVQDFELNTRNVSGGQGLIQLQNGDQDPCVFNLVIPPGNNCPANTAINTGRSADQDAIAAYHAFGIRPWNAALHGQNTLQGRLVFTAAKCQGCHGGVKWTRSRVNFQPPPNPADINAGQLVAFLNPVGSFNPNDFNEIKANVANTTVANGALGFNIPSILSISQSAPFFHNGEALNLDAVLLNVEHRSAGTNGQDTLTDANKRAQLVKFLKSIDLQTPPFP